MVLCLNSKDQFIVTSEMDLVASELVARRYRALEVTQNEADAGAGTLW